MREAAQKDMAGDETGRDDWLLWMEAKSKHLMLKHEGRRGIKLSLRLVGFCCKGITAVPFLVVQVRVALDSKVEPRTHSARRRQLR